MVLVVVVFVVEVSDPVDVVVGHVVVSDLVEDADLVVAFDLVSVPAEVFVMDAALVVFVLAEVVVPVVEVSDPVDVVDLVVACFLVAAFDPVADLAVGVDLVEVGYPVAVSVQVLHLDLILELASSCSKVYSFLHDILHHIPAHLEQVLQDEQILDF